MRFIALTTLLVLALAGPAAAAADGEWLAGDNHVHSCYSHDSWCPDEAPQPETLYSSFATVQQRFAEASAKGLDYLVISDHDDIRAQSDPAFGAGGVLGIPGYEASIRGHAQLLGATTLYDKGDGSPAAANAMADALTADGGVFQANHPSYRAEREFSDCAQAAGADNPLHWGYGYDVVPDSIEAWNPTQQLTPAEIYWECWLQRDPGNVRIGLTGGSDTHGAQQPTVANPATWVFASERSRPAILDGIRAGRTTVSRLAPVQGGGRLLLEADGDGDGSFEAMIGDAVEPGSTVRIRGEGFAHPGRLRVRFNGRTVMDEPLMPGETATFDPPAEPGWVRAVLYLQQETMGADPGCQQPFAAESPISFCATDLAVAAMTSPLYFVPPVVEPEPEPEPEPCVGRGCGNQGNGVGNGGAAPEGPHKHEEEPDDDPAMAPAAQTPRGTTLQRVRGVRVRASAVRLRIVRLRRARARLAWGPTGERFDVQVRRRGRWVTVARDTRARSLVLALRRGAAVRVRIDRPFAPPGRWITSR